MAADSSALLKAGAATRGSTDGPEESGSARTMKALSVELPTAEAPTTADNYAARPRLVQVFGVLVALALVAAGAIFDMKAAQEASLELVLMAVRQDGRALQWAGDDFKDNKAVVLAAVQQIGHAVEFASERLKGDREVALMAARHSKEGVLVRLLAYFEDDLEVQLEAVRHEPRELKSATLVKNNKPAVLDAVRHDGRLLTYADDSLKMDKEVVLEAVRQNGEALVYLHRSIPTSKWLKDREVVLEAVRTYGPALEVVSKAAKAFKKLNATVIDLTQDREVVLAAVHQDGEMLRFASATLKEDKAVVMAAVVDQGVALQWAKGEAKTEAAFAALCRDSRAVKWASAVDLDMMSDLADNWRGTSYDCKELANEIKRVKRILGEDDSEKMAVVQRKMELAAVRYDGTCLASLKHLQNDATVVDAAVRQKGMALKYVDPKLRKDREVVLAAVRQDGLALEFSELKDKDVVLAAVQHNGLALKHAESLIDNPESYREVVLAAVRQNGKALEHAPTLKNDREVVLAAVRNDRPVSAPKAHARVSPGYWHSQALRHADEKFLKDRDVVLEALRSNGRALEFVKVTEITATWERTVIAGVMVLVLCIVVVVRLVFTPHEASSDTADTSERV